MIIIFFLILKHGNYILCENPNKNMNKYENIFLSKTWPHARFVSGNKILETHNFWNKEAIFMINNNIQMLYHINHNFATRFIAMSNNIKLSLICGYITSKKKTIINFIFARS